MKSSKWLKALLFVTLMSPAVSQARDYDLQLDLKFGNFAYNVEKAGGNSSSVSGVGSYMPTVRIGFDKFVAYGGLVFTLSNLIFGDVFSGFVAGINYYPISGSGYKHHQSETLDYSITNRWRHYVGVAAKQLTLVEVVSSTYVGFALNGGTEYLLTQKAFVSGQFTYDFLVSNDATLTNTSILIGIGLHL